jgi:hypothetical protein
MGILEQAMNAFEVNREFSETFVYKKNTLRQENFDGSNAQGKSIT